MFYGVYIIWWKKCGEWLNRLGWNRSDVEVLENQIERMIRNPARPSIVNQNSVKNKHRPAFQKNQFNYSYTYTKSKIICNNTIHLIHSWGSIKCLRSDRAVSCVRDNCLAVRESHHAPLMRRRGTFCCCSAERHAWSRAASRARRWTF